MSVTTAKTEIVVGGEKRKSVIIKNGDSSAATIYCGPKSQETFEITAGQAIVLEITPQLSVWCKTTSGTASVFFWKTGKQ